MQVGAGVLRAGAPDHVAGVAHQTQHLVGVQVLALRHKDLAQVGVAARVVRTVDDQHRVTVAGPRTVIVPDAAHGSGQHGRDGLAVVLTAESAEVQGVAVVRVGPAVVDVASGVVLLRHGPPLP